MLVNNLVLCFNYMTCAHRGVEGNDGVPFRLLKEFTGGLVNPGK